MQFARQLGYRPEEAVRLIKSAASERRPAHSEDREFARIYGTRLDLSGGAHCHRSIYSSLGVNPSFSSSHNG